MLPITVRHFKIIWTTIDASSIEYSISLNGLSTQNDGRLGSNVWQAFSKSPVIYLQKTYNFTLKIWIIFLDNTF